MAGFKPGAWKVTDATPPRLIGVRPSERVNEPDWANHAHMEGVRTVIRVNTPEDAAFHLPALVAYGIPKGDLSFYRTLHDLGDA